MPRSLERTGNGKAENLVQELRTKYHLNAYTYRHRFDFSQNVQGIGWEVVDVEGRKDIIPKQMKHAKSNHFEEIAVLVGDFPTVEDSRAQKTLKQIKMLQPNSLAQL